jgi:hypothetical protein
MRSAELDHLDGVVAEQGWNRIASSGVGDIIVGWADTLNQARLQRQRRLSLGND